ncbi:beta strand repeat-containing protein [Mesorhizobium caraganae]|uniref:beta strand repeat-containing protein n=1 Tax=Mesorhizobium caraganae TaxID=483206 RepID=UPI003ECD1487
MSITFDLHDKAVNDQTALLQTGDSDDGFTDTDVAYSSLPPSFQTYLQTTLGLSSAFPTSIGVATKVNSVTVNATAGSQLAGTSFTDGSGGALDGDDSLLKTADGKEIFLYADGSDTVIGKYDSDGVNGVDSIAFVIFKEDVINAGKTSDAVTFHIVTYVPIFHSNTGDPDDAVDLGNTLKLAATETLNFGFAGAPSGSNLFMMFGNPNSTQIVVIGKDPLNQSAGGNITTKDVLNISQAGSTTSFGVNGNQINPDEGAFITYVTGANTNFLVPNLDQNEADVEANIAFTDVVAATTASFTVNQTNPGIGPVTVKITAYTTANQSGTNFVDGLTDDTHVTITSASVANVVVKTGNTQYFPATSIDANGDLIITGLSSGDTVTWTTSGTHNRVLIENISNADGVDGNDNNTFDIGGFGIVTSSGSSTFVGQQIVIEDDGPTASQAQQTGTVDEDGVPGGIAGGTGDVAGQATVATGSVTPLFNSGTDVPLTFSLNTDTTGLPALTSGGVAVTYSVVGNTLTASAGANTVFTFALNGTTGAWTFTLADQLDHPTLNGLPGDNEENDLTINLSSILRAADADGDTVAAAANALVVTVDDDTPTASQAQQTGTVDEDGVPGGIAGGTGDVAGEVTVASGSVTPLFNSGADAPLTFSLNSNTSGLPALTSGGVAVTYSVVGNTLTASAGANTVFTFALNGTTGAWTFTLADQLDHPTLNGLPGDNEENDLAVNLSSLLRATDADGDTVAAAANALIVTVDDDTPTINPAIADGLVDFAAGSTVTKSLNGSVGADSPATYSITASPATLTILDGTSSQLTLLRDLTNSDTVATYYKDVDSSGTHTAGDIDFFKLTLSGGNYTFDVLQNPPPAELNFSFAGAPSGSNLFMTFGSPTSTQIVVIGEDPLNQSQGGNINTKDVLNISQAGSTTSFGVNGNQINPGEGAFITFVTGANTNFLVPNLDQNEADVEANIDFTGVFNTNTASFTVNQTNPGVGPVTVKITAFSTAAEPGVNFVDGLTNDSPVAITSASVTDFVVKTGNTQYTPVATVNPDGTLTITGLSTGDKVSWTTSGTHDRVLIENISDADGLTGNDNNTFDIGGFGLSQAQPAPDEKLDFTVQIADFDGDTASDTFSIGIDGTGIFNDNHVEGVIA